MNPYIMVGICVISGLLLIFRLAREDKIFYGIGAFLIALGGWTLADTLLSGALSASWAIWVQRAAILAMIIFLIVRVSREKKKNKPAKTQADDTTADDSYFRSGDEDTQKK